MVGWHHEFNGHEFEQALGVGDGQGSLACCSPWGCKESDTAEQPLSPRPPALLRQSRTLCQGPLSSGVTITQQDAARVSNPLANRDAHCLGRAGKISHYEEVLRVWVITSSVSSSYKHFCCPDNFTTVGPGFSRVLWK